MITETSRLSISEDGGEFAPAVTIQDLLDRFELLYPHVDELRLIRRIYNDQDLSSVFKLIDNDDLRRAVLEDNLHSLFRVLESHEPRLANHEDLRKAVLEKNLHSVFRCLEEIAVKSGAVNEDLRKAVIDQNLHSIFRIFQNANIENMEVDDLRKAVLDQNLRSLFRLYDAQAEDLAKSVNDQNLYSIFRLYESTDYLRKAVIDKNIVSLLTMLDLIDIKKLIVEDNRLSMYRILNDYIPESNILKSLRQLEMKNIPFSQDCVSRGQLQSKIWLIDHLEALDLDLGCVFLCAGWYATLAAMMFEQGLKISKVRSFDIDPSCESIAELFNKPWVVEAWKFKSTTKDIMEINYKIEEYTVTKHDGTTETLWDIPDTVINTSCEHIQEFSQWYAKMPDGVLLILQTNDFVDIDDHVNCSTTLEDFSAKTPMSECLFQGELDLGNYKRFMRIGYR
jgi:hypothetical protein